MAISLNNKTRLTAESEKLFVGAGGADTTKTLSQDEIATALANTINQLAERESPILLKLYRQYEKDGRVPHIESLDINRCL